MGNTSSKVNNIAVYTEVPETAGSLDTGEATGEKETKRSIVKPNHNYELILGIREGNLNRMKQAVANGADINHNLIGPDGYMVITPIIYAIVYGYFEGVKWLYDNGASVKMLLKTHFDGKIRLLTPTDYGLCYNNKFNSEMYDWLIQQGSPITSDGAHFIYAQTENDSHLESAIYIERNAKALYIRFESMYQCCIKRNKIIAHLLWNSKHAIEQDLA